MTRKTFALALGLALFAGQAKAQNTSSESLRVWMDDITITADGTTATRLTVYEKDTERNYTAFNMSVILPEGISVKQVKDGRDFDNSIEMSERGTATHNISCNMPTETLLKIICTSTRNEDIYPDDEEGNPLEELFYIDLIADPSMQTGTYTVTTEGIVFAHNNAGVTSGYVPMEAPSFHITVKSESDTAINAPAAKQGASDEWYDLEGRRTKPTRQGVYVQQGKKKVKGE